MKKILLLCLLAAGCGAVKPPATVRVEIPIPIPCKVVVPDPPVFAVDALPLNAGIWDMMNALRADRIQRRAYEKSLEAAVKACQ